MDGSAHNAGLHRCMRCGTKMDVKNSIADFLKNMVLEISLKKKKV